MKNDKKRDILKYFIPPLITIVAILIIYAVKGFYPFGNETIMDNDWGAADFPSLVRFWDVAHGRESIVFDWSTGLGLPKNNIAAFFYPINYLLLVFRRDYLYEAMNYYFIAQMSAVSVTAFAFFKNAFKKLPLSYSYLFSVAFTFCGFNLQYYTNIGWISAIAVFPLVALSCYKLLKEKSFVFYTVMLAYSLVVNTYFTFFMLEGIVLVGTMFIFCFLEKDERKGAAFRLGTGTVSAFLISFWAVYAFLFSTASSTRVQSDISSGILAKYIELLKTENIVNSYKLLMLLGTEIGIAALAAIVIKCRKEKKKPVFFISGFVMLVLPVIIESTDLILNGGSYNFYPMRNGFLLAFFLYMTAAYYFSFHDGTNTAEKNKIIAYVKPVACILALYVVVPYHLVMLRPIAGRDALNDNGKAMGLAVLSNLGSSFLIILVALVLFFIIKNKKIRTAFFVLLVSFLIVANSYSTIGAGKKNPESTNESEEYILDCRQLYDTVREDDCFKRISNPTEELLTNYPVLIDRTAASDWSHIVSSDFRETFYRLGYGLAFTDVSDVGGTAFSNALINVENAVSKKTLNGDVYRKEGSVGDYTYYSCIYTLPFGLTADGKADAVSFNGNLFEYQNEIFRSVALTDDSLFEQPYLKESSVGQYNGELISIYDNNYKIEKEMTKGTFTYHVGEKSVLYFYLDDGSDILSGDVKVDNCRVQILQNGKELFDKPIEYRTMHSNNIIELGTFENTDITVELDSTRTDIDKPVVYAMSLDKLGELCENCKPCVIGYSTGKQSIRITAAGEEGKYLFVPVYNNGDWVCRVNGERVEVKNIFGSFTAVPLRDGENNIRINYVPLKLYVTLAFSAVMLLAFVLALLFIKRKQLKEPEKLQGLFLWALTGLFSVFIAVAYIIPLIAQIYYAFAGRE